MKVAVLLSGGLDSTTALHWAHRHHEVVCALSFDYGSNHAARELACARWQAELLGVPYHEIDLRSISAHLQSALLSGADAIPTADYAEDNLRQTVVPFRNGIFLAIAAGIAESNKAEGIVIAAHGGDHALYPDCREDFMAAMASAISLGTYAGLQILRPFITNTKAEITAIGAALGVDFAHTYSCYCGREQHCGQCATCRERRESFASAGIPDPTEYES
ncbi:MAG: 7-cyano-7-deazaguanine synthase QueC [Akkermansia sp.]|nr:7-cyano-7-deazaguanine synthase QueC [Akkermansia sp.]